MQADESEMSKAENVTAALLYLMTHYARTGCPRLAICIARHMQCLALHPDSPLVVRNICASMHSIWSEAACSAEEGTVH